MNIENANGGNFQKNQNLIEKCVLHLSLQRNFQTNVSKMPITRKPMPKLNREEIADSMNEPKVVHVNCDHKRKGRCTRKGECTCKILVGAALEHFKNKP